MKPLVTVDWLRDKMGDPRLVIHDASLSKPVNSSQHSVCKAIPGAFFFDLEGRFSDGSSDLPNTMIGEEIFESGVRKFGIGKSSVIVIYDNIGIYSSARAWWMFRSMGHKDVFVLDGGLREWERRGFCVSDCYATPAIEGDFVANLNPSLFCGSLDVVNAIGNSTIIDVRAQNRFYGRVDETRKGLRKGHIPTAVNIPFENFLENGRLKSKAEILSVLENVPRSSKLIFSCGSGVTACIGALAATEAGFVNVVVYDGSWSDWGRESNGLPIE